MMTRLKLREGVVRRVKLREAGGRIGQIALLEARRRRRPVESTTCCVYGEGRMLVNALLALGSFKHFAPDQPAILFTSHPKRCRWLKNVEVVSADKPLRGALIDVAGFEREHPGITGHYYRKAAMWLHALRDGSRCGNSWLTFIDADVLFVRPMRRLLRHVRGQRFAAMVEHWHPSIWSVLRKEPGANHREVNQLFHGAARPGLLRRTRYYNSGVMMARPGDDDVIAAVKDVLAASLLYPRLSRGLRLPEQTLMNVATATRGVRVCDLFGLCVPSYHRSGKGTWPTPAVVRHYLGDPLSRQPAALAARYPKLVAQSLAAVGTSIEDLRDRGLWQDQIQAVSVQQYASAAAMYGVDLASLTASAAGLSAMA
jgi:hypothetical protein